MNFAVGFAVGFGAASVLVSLYARYVVSAFKSEAAKVGVFFQKVSGKWQAVKKDL